MNTTDYIKRIIENKQIMMNSLTVEDKETHEFIVQLMSSYIKELEMLNQSLQTVQN